MLDQDLKEQLVSAFKNLSQDVVLTYDDSAHAQQSELLELLNDLASTSNKIKLKESKERKNFPQFHIETLNKPNGIYFSGIPGGHEFTSLVLAILNSDGKGKFPDEFIKQRIRKLKGPIYVKTYVSLTCENCPEVVQSLNQLALIHSDFKHEMIDGGFVQEEIQKLGIQGVPSIVVNDRMIHSGRIHLLDLLSKLEETFGINQDFVSEESKSDLNKEKSSTDSDLNGDLGHFQVVVLGGGPAGVSSAIYASRKGLSTALIAEKVGGQVQETKGIENLISVVYTEGPQLAAQLQKHLEEYPVKLFENRRAKEVIEIKKYGENNDENNDKKSDEKNDEKKIVVQLESGEQISTDSLIISTGAKWRELGVPGEKEFLGRGVAYCPHCDGPFYKGKKVAVVGGGNSGVEAAIDLAGIVGEVVLFEYQENLKADKILVDKLKSLKNISIITSAQITKILGKDQKVNQLEFKHHSHEVKTMNIDGVFIQIGLIPNSHFVKSSSDISQVNGPNGFNESSGQYGQNNDSKNKVTLDLNKMGEIIVDHKGRTSNKHIYAAGDVTNTPFKQIIIAMGEGAKVALTVFEDQILK